MANKKPEIKEVYMDYAATTPISSEVYREMLDVYQKTFGNSSSLHYAGRAAQAILEQARIRVAKAIGAKAGEVYFTSGGTESNNWAIKGVARANRGNGNHIITSSIEHPSVLEACRSLEKEGFRVTYIPVDSDGVVDYAAIIKAICPETILISVMLANNEVGSIQPIRAIAELAHSQKILVHTDAVQALGVLPVNVDDLGADLVTISAHKIYGPKGVGALYVRKGVKISKFMDGGEQEKDMRAGTCNIPAIAGMGRAVEIAAKEQEQTAQTLKNIKRYFWKKVSDRIYNISLNGNLANRLPNNLNISFEGVEGESLLMMLDFKGIAVSTGSACSSGSVAPSHVLLAMGKTAEQARSSIRFSFGKHITPPEVDYVVEELYKAVKKLRSISAIRIYKDKDGEEE